VIHVSGVYWKDFLGSKGTDINYQNCRNLSVYTLTCKQDYPVDFKTNALDPSCYAWDVAVRKLFIYTRPLWRTYYMNSESNFITLVRNKVFDGLKRLHDSESFNAGSLSDMQLQYAVLHVLAPNANYPAEIENAVRYLFFRLNCEYFPIMSGMQMVQQMQHPLDTLVASVMLDCIAETFAKRYPKGDWLWPLSYMMAIRSNFSRDLSTAVGLMFEEVVAMAILLSFRDISGPEGYVRWSDLIDRMGSRCGLNPFRVDESDNAKKSSDYVSRLPKGASLDNVFISVVQVGFPQALMFLLMTIDCTDC
jgi:hypothetical protein